MLDNKDSVDNNDLGKDKDEEPTLENILKIKPSLDIDVMDFLLIAGWDYWGSPFYNKISNKLKTEICRYSRERRERISSSEKHRESRFRNSILEGGYRTKFKTIGELKYFIEDEGIRIRNMHYKTLVHFNNTLKEYGIEPIKVGGKHTPGILRNLQKYGLEPTQRYVAL